VNVGTDTVHECIYCRRSLAAQEFTREHVLSRAFGPFADAPTLLNMVCGDCNQFFGDHLERRVARGAFEGLLRYQRGAKAPDREMLRLPYVEFTLPEGQRGQCAAESSTMWPPARPARWGCRLAMHFSLSPSRLQNC